MAAVSLQNRTRRLTALERRMLKKPVGDRILHARLRRGLTQGELADAIGTDYRHVLKWEGGKYPPSRRYRERLAEKLDFPLEFFQHDGRGGRDD